MILTFASKTGDTNKPHPINVWPSFPSRALARRPSKFLPFPLSEPECRLFARARHCLWHGLLALGLERGDEVLVPACHEASQVEAVLRAGMTCRFYNGNESLEPDESELEARLRPRVRALLLTHYLGFPQDARRWRRFCDRHGLALIEDSAQAWLASADGHPAGSLGDLSIFCLYKTYGLPDGAALLIRSPHDGDAVGRTLRKPVQWSLVSSEATGWLAALAAGARRTPFPGEEGFTLGNPSSSPSSVTRFLLPRVVDEGTAARRRANYSMLLDELSDLVPPAFAHLPEGASPFVFPVQTRSHPHLLERLAGHGVRPHELWSRPHPAFASADIARAAAPRRTLVGLPVHQDLRLEEIERLTTAIRKRPSKSATPRLEFLPTLDSIREEWSELATLTRNIFATWEWNSIWWRHFGGRRTLLATACLTSGGRLEAVLPLYFWSMRPLRVVRFLGHGAGNELGPICRPTARTFAARALLRTLATVDCDVFFGEELPRAAGWPSLLGGKVHRSIGDPLIRLEAASWDDFLGSRSSNFRQQVRRRERNLARDHALRYRLADDAARLEEDLDILFRLHRARWGDRPSSFAASEPFHRDFAARAFELGWLRLWFLELDGEAVAAWYGFRFCGVESYYQAGRNPEWSDSTVGFVLLAHTIRQALEDGMDTYRMGRGATPYKSRFADEDPGLEAVVLACTAVGAASVAGGHVARSFAPLKKALKAPLDI
jgi:CelD/BcsL family acetyltransferase involved in cellulose biosynthesis